MNKAVNELEAEDYAKAKEELANRGD